MPNATVKCAHSFEYCRRCQEDGVRKVSVQTISRNLHQHRNLTFYIVFWDFAGLEMGSCCSAL